MKLEGAREILESTMHIKMNAAHMNSCIRQPSSYNWPTSPPINQNYYAT